MFKNLLNLLKDSSLPLLTTLLCLNASAQNCETVLDDFESNRQISAYSVTSPGTLVQNQANPATTGINTSSTCAKYTPNTGVYEQGVVLLKLDKIKNANLFRNGLLKIKLDIHAQSTGNVTLQLRRNGTLHTSLYTQFGTINAWTTLYVSVDPNTTPSNTVFADSINEIRLVFPASSGVVYLDNIIIHGAYNSIDNFDSERNTALSSFQGTFNPAFSNGAANSVNSSSKCATFRKATGNGNALIKYPINATAASRLKSEIDKFGIMLYVLASPIPVKISLLDTNVVPNAVHSVYQGTTATGTSGTWSFVSLALASKTSVLDSDVDVLALEIDPGVITTTLYRYDDFLTYNRIPIAPTIVGTASPCTGTNLYDYSVTDLEFSYEWAIKPQGTISAGANTSKAKALFTNAPTSIECRAVIPGGCASTWGSLNFTNVNKPATANAAKYYSSSGSVCQNKGVQLLGTFQGANAAVWSTNGTGTFTPNNTLATATYMPSEDDADLGSVELTYTAQGGNCGTQSSTLGISIIPTPKIASITPSMEVCANQASVKVSAASNVSGIINWYAYPGTFNKPKAANGEEVIFNIDSYYATVGSSVELKAETDYNYACGTTAAYVTIKFVGSNASVVTKDYACHNDSIITLSSVITGAATGGIWSSATNGIFSPNVTTLTGSYKVSEQDKTNGKINLTFTTTGDPKCVITKERKITILAPFTQPELPPIAPHCGARVLNIALDSAKGYPNIRYEWQHSSDLKLWSSLSQTTPNLVNYEASVGFSYYIRRAAIYIPNYCIIGTKPVLLQTGLPVTNNTVTGSNTLCYGDLPGIFTGSTPTGGLATSPYYKWQVSSTGDSSSFVDISGRTSKDMQPDINPNSQYFRRIVLSKYPDACPNSISNIVTTTVQKCTGINAIIPKTEFCEGDEFVVDYTTTNLTFPIGNVFTVQISASTNFNSKISLGTLLSSETSGKISCKFEGPASGGNYFLRVVSSDPAHKSYIVRSIVFRAVRTGFTLNANGVNLNTPVILSNNVGNLKTGSWNFGTGAVFETPVSLLNPMVTYPTTGARTITLSATDIYGCSKTFSNQVTVYDVKCDATPSPRTTIFAADSTSGALPNNSSAWVKAGAVYRHTAGNNDTIYVSSGGRLFVPNAVSGLVIYLEPNAYFLGGSSSISGYLIYSPKSILSANKLNNNVLCNQVSINGGVVTGLQDGDNGFATAPYVYPNPAMEGKFTIKAPETVTEVTLVNSLGMKETFYGTQIATHMKGLLIVNIKTANQVYTQKITVIE